VAGALAEAGLPSYEQWLKAQAVLLGESKRISIAAAAKAAGISILEFNRLVDRAREGNPTDPPWVGDVAEVLALRDDVIHSAAIDGLYELAMPHEVVTVRETDGVTNEGVPVSSTVTTTKTERSVTALRELTKLRDGKPAGKTINHNHNIRIFDADEALKRFRAHQRMKEVREEAKGSGLLIDGDPERVRIDDFDDE